MLGPALGSDGLSSIFSFVSSRLQLAYSLEHKTYWLVPPDPAHNTPGFVYPDSWDFPPDPWKREWWSKDRPVN